MQLNQGVLSLFPVTLLVLMMLFSTWTFAENQSKSPSTAQVETFLKGATGFASKDKLKKYRIQPGDVLDILVWKEPDLSKEFSVAPDGYVSFPLVGQVLAKGKSLDVFQSELRLQLSEYIPEPSVTVVLLSVLGNKFYVLGKVNRPGEFAMSYPISVLQALSMAGGMSTYADGDKIQIIRKAQGGHEEAIRFNYDQVIKGKGLNQNIQLESGDVLLVP